MFHTVVIDVTTALALIIASAVAGAVVGAIAGATVGAAAGNTLAQIFNRGVVRRDVPVSVPTTAPAAVLAEQRDQNVHEPEEKEEAMSNGSGDRARVTGINRH
jgi:hypothetical protein